MAMGMLTTAAGIGRRRGPIDCPSYSSQGRKLARNAAWPEIGVLQTGILRSRKPVWIAAPYKGFSDACIMPHPRAPTRGDREAPRHEFRAITHIGHSQCANAAHSLQSRTIVRRQLLAAARTLGPT